MKKLLIIILALTFLAPVFAFGSPQNLDQLLQAVKKEQVNQRPELKKREAEFLAQKEHQKKLLEQAKAELRVQERTSKKLQKTFEVNETKLTQLEEKLTIAKGTLGELFGVVKQVAGDTRSQLAASVVSAEFPGRTKFPEQLAARKELPSIPDLEKLWIGLMQEMVESGKITQFESQVVKPSGETSIQKITRVGSFNLVSDGLYLTYQPETQQVTELARQPAGRFLSLIDNLEESKVSFTPFAVDPSRGTILSMLVQAPSLLERIQQGGVVGYVIIGILIFGLALSVHRFVFLKTEDKNVTHQLNSEEILNDNSLGKVLKVYDENQNMDVESLELKLDEAILKVSPRIERGLSTVKILAAVAPLMGLLGTVTGMIATFQSITLFGTGDPKLMAGGISQALVTTVLGLVCAIPLLLIYNTLAEKSKRIIQVLEEQTAGLIAQKIEGKL